MVSSETIAIPVSSNTATQGFSSIGHSRLSIEAPIKEAIPADEPMDLASSSGRAGMYNSSF